MIIKLRRYKSGEPFDLDLAQDSGGPHVHDERYPLKGHQHEVELPTEVPDHPHADLTDAVASLSAELELKAAATDPRLNDARQPLDHAHDELIPANDPRLSDARPPLAHTHDPIAPEPHDHDGAYATTGALEQVAAAADLAGETAEGKVDAATVDGMIDAHETARDHLTPAEATLAAAAAVDGHLGVAEHLESATVDAAIGAAVDAHLNASQHGPGTVVGVVPVGGIVLWSGSIASIPAGWSLCNGTNGTPDLRERFVLGAGTTAVGATGGTTSHGHAAHDDHGALTHAGAAVADHVVTQPSAHTVTQPDAHTQVPAHTHPEQMQGGTSAATGGTNLMGSTATGGSLRTSSQSTLPPTGAPASIAHTGAAVSAHAGAAVSAHGVTQPSQHAAQQHSAHDSVAHRPPFYALAYIMRTA